MATIDPSIALSVKPIQIQDPLNRMAAMMQIEGGQQSQQLNALKIKEAEQGIENRNMLRGLDPNDPDYVNKIIRFDPALGLEIQAKQNAAKTAGLQATKLKGEISEQDRTESRENFKNLVFNTSDENVLSHLQDSVLKKRLTPEAAQQQWATVAPMNETQRKQHFTMLSLKADKYFELNKPQYIQENLGGVNRVSAFPGMGGAPTVVSEAKREATPGELLVDKRTREAVARGENPNIVANTTTDAAGNVTQFNKFGEVVGKVNAAGKPSATFEKAANVKAELQKNLGTTITELKDAIKPGGLLEESTASGAGKVLDAAGNFVGYATKGSIAAASLAPIADMALKMVPRFEGPQSDKDTASYKEAAGQLANSALPVATRKAAAKTIIRIMENRKNQFTTEGMINEGISSGGPALPPGFTVDK